MIINSYDYVKSLKPVMVEKIPAINGKRPFSDIMSNMTAGNPTPAEIKTMATYLQLRLNEALLQAMNGSHSASSIPLFIKPSVKVQETAASSSHQKPPATSVEQIVQQAADVHNMDPSLIRAVIKAESGGNPRATSPKGAMGMMQLMPGTARELGVTDPYDPVQNVMGGVKYLKKLLSRYNGNQDLALAAYNWGPGNLEKSHRLMPRETIDYVAKIKRYLEEKV